MEKDCSSSTKEQKDIPNNFKEKYPLKQNRTREGFLEYARNNRKKNKEFYDAWGNE